ncbi:polymeric immunoglobulin receptor [Salarias fasciatus]|uniref:CMRF35-like molecule 5 n=1 Tax=Salarias fasciatus TaxID=181472 RepID=A0A672HJY3_SALFA|nr:CMRF35-like molecule 5 [Salarias fasciatus]
MPRLFLLTLGLLPWIPVFLCEITTEEELAVLEGGSLTIPCHYEPQFAGYVKYWCQGRIREFCTSMAQTDELPSADTSEARVSISDDPVQQVFTVTMRDMKEADSGWYMCGVKIGGVWSTDDSAFTHIKVVHGMSIVNSRVSGEEGSSVTVECLYSEKYRESERKWCRSGDWNSCRRTGPDGSYEDASVAISDDRTGAFTVTLKKLQMRDAGWYWCSAGQQKVGVHVLVSARPTAAAVSVTSAPTPSPTVEHLPPQKSSANCWHRHSRVWVSVVVCSTLLLLLCVALLARKLWKLHMKDPSLRKSNAMTGTYKEFAGEDMQSAAVIILSKDSPLMY